MKKYYIVGRMENNRLIPYKKNVDDRSVPFYNDQQSAQEVMESMVKQMGGEWLLFETRAIAASKITTRIFDEEENKEGQCGCQDCVKARKLRKS